MMSVVYRLFFTVFIIIVSAPSSAQVEPERHYRVELIVVRHLAGSSDSTPQQHLRDLTELLDLYAPGDYAAKELQAAPPATSDPANPDPQSGLEPEEPPAVRVDDMSDTMREAWRRLRGSAGFRPELFRAWEQSGDQPFPNLRIHDDEVLFEVESGAVLDRLPLDEHGARVFSDQTLQQQEGNPAGMEEDGATQVYYRIDGSARLTRTRYLNLDVDIELREPLYDLPEQVAGTTRAFRVHRIEQRRQVKAEQMEYFDGPVIGILALVTGFDVTAADSPTNSTPDSTVGVQQPVD